jgi:hypothetical protein
MHPTQRPLKPEHHRRLGNETAPKDAQVPQPREVDDLAHRRIIGRRRSPDLATRTGTAAGGAAGPTPEEIEWLRAMSNYRTRVPKGVFRYRSHEEANADWERWHAELVAATARHLEGGPAW